jgi:hypothetical protein
VQRLVAARAQDRLTQPLQAEREQSAPTTKRSESIGISRSAGPSTATIAASTTVAGPTPTSVERQPRTTPTASTIVRASTASTALAAKVVRKSRNRVAHGSSL